MLQKIFMHAPDGIESLSVLVGLYASQTCAIGPKDDHGQLCVVYPIDSVCRAMIPKMISGATVLPGHHDPTPLHPDHQIHFHHALIAMDKDPHGIKPEHTMRHALLALHEHTLSADGHPDT